MPGTKTTKLPLSIAAVAAACLLACEPATETVTQVELPPLAVTAWSPTPLLPGSALRLRGTGFLPPEIGDNVITLSGTAAGKAVDIELTGKLASADELVADVSPELLAALPPGGPTLEGTIRVTRTVHATGTGSWYEFPIELSVKDNLTPAVTGVSPEVLFPGDLVTIAGAGFLLPGEGTSSVVFDGSFEALNPPTTKALHNIFIPATAISREALQLRLTPDLFGVKPGKIKGTLRVANTTDAGTEESEPLTGLSLPLEKPYLESVSPTSLSRGQILRFHGRGFLPTDAAFQATSLILVEGTFTSGTRDPITFSGVDALSLFPDRIDDNTTMEYVLRVNIDLNGQLVGLGLISGTLTGTVTPWILSGTDAVLGQGTPFEVQILPQRQVIYVKYLPGFTESLDHFGLRVVEDRIRERIAQVALRDYAGVNIVFQEERPVDFAEYGVVEVGGTDPNGADLFGLDNTEGKDVGNLRFNDVIGGLNAETEEEGYYAYGGVFVESFLGLSPGLGHGNLPIRDARFDAIFGPFIPALGGAPVAEGEPGSGPRAAQVDEAVRVLGNLIGNTITHEVGHSLGLTALDGEFHNVGDNPGWIMDSGSFRPFAERAEIDGEGPAVFSPFNRTYLESILPVE